MGLEGRGRTVPRALLIGVFVIVLVLSSAHSENTTDIMGLKCSTGKQILIRRAIYENSSLCASDCQQSQQTESSLVDCFGGLNMTKLKPRFTLQLLKEVYTYAEVQDKKALKDIKKKLKPLGGYRVFYDCIDSRQDTFNPCADEVRSDRNTLFFLSSKRDKTPCRRDCTLSVRPHHHKHNKTPEWELQFLLKAGAPEENSKVLFQAEQDQQRRINQTHLVTERLRPRKRDHTFDITMKFRIENEVEVLRIWIKFPDAKVNVTCQKARESITTTPTPSTTPRNPRRRKKLFLTLLVIPAVLAFLAVVICVVILILRRSESQRSKTAERHGILTVALNVVPQRSHPSQPRHSYFSNQAFTDSFNASHPAPASGGAFRSPTRNGSDDRRYTTNQYGTLDHHGTGNRRREAEDDYNHVPVQREMEGEGYERFRRDRGRQIVIDNPYDRAHTS